MPLFQHQFLHPKAGSFDALWRPSKRRASASIGRSRARVMIGDVELIQIIFALGANAYTGSVAREIRKRAGCEVHVGWLHMRLNRLKSLGLLIQMKDGERVNGNRPKSLIRLTPKGEQIGQLGSAPGRANASLREALD